MTKQKRVKRVWVDDSAVYAETTDGTIGSYPFAMWPRLAQASAEERKVFVLTYSGIHWPEIDEDLSFEGMFSYSGLTERTVCEDTVVYEKI